MRRQKLGSKVVPHGGAVVHEDLPLEFVYFPWSGPWIEFRAEEQSTPAYCLCFRKALFAYLTLQTDAHSRHEFWYKYKGRTIKSLLSPNHFSPLAMDNYLQLDEHLRMSPDAVITQMSFEEKLCHICNHKIPTRKFCVPMYGGPFRQAYGWYIEKHAYQLGLRKTYYDQPYFNQVSRELPEDILEDVVEMDALMEAGQHQRSSAREDATGSEPLSRAPGSAWHRINRWIENQVRDSVGYQRVGEGWSSETLLYKIVQSLLPEEKVEFHARPTFLKGLELDIYVPARSLGLEYQGVQHYEPLDHWGGEEAFARLQERDARKKQLCVQNGIAVVYFRYDDDLNAEAVRERLRIPTPSA